MERRLLKYIVLSFGAAFTLVIADPALAQTRLKTTNAAIAELLQDYWNDQLQQPASQTAVPQEATQEQSVSQTGVLPVFAVDMDIDPSWVDGDAVPSTSPQFSHNGVNDTLDQAWTRLKPSGFDMIRFPVRLDDPKSPVRLANLCLWAKANNITLIPVLQGTAAMRKDSSAMSPAIGTFISSVISSMRGGDGSALASYAQIGFYQLERPMNHAGLYPKMKPGSAQQLLTAASAALRQAESQALQGTGVQPTPISIGVSFDFELIQQGAIAGVPLDPNAEQRAQDSLKQYLTGFASQNIDAINVEWFPRSFSSGDVDHFVTLLRVLKQSYADKQFTLTTGFSSAFNTPDQALQFYAVAISNLGSFRASEGVDSKFVGVVFEQAFKGANADVPAPSGTSDPSQWKWSDRAQQLSAMWSQGATFPDMAWWANKVQDNMALMALQSAGTGSSSVTPLPSLQAFQDINSALTQASQQVQTPPSFSTPSSAGSTDSAANTNLGSAANTNPGSAFVPPAVATGYVPGAQSASQTAASPFQQLLFNLLQGFTQQISTKLMMKLGGSNQLNQNYNPGYSALAPSSGSTSPYTSANGYPNAAPTSRSTLANTVWIGPADINLSTATPGMGQSVAITAQVHNQSSDQDISGLTVQLVNPANPAVASPSMQSGVTVPRSGITPVQLTWAPDATSVGQVQLLLQALDYSGQVVTSVAIPKITVLGTNSASNGIASGTVPVTSPTNAGSSANASFPNAAASFTSSGSSSWGSNLTAVSKAQLAVTGFGPTDPNASAAGQIPQLTAQVLNPSQIPTQSGQAQLFVDGTPLQMQTLGTILPSGTLPLQFSAIQASTGQHNLQLVVTTADGVSASATFTANVSTMSASSSSGNSSPGASQTSISGSGRPPRSISVRAAAPTTFQIGNIMRATTSSPRGTTLAGNLGGPVTTSPPPATAQSQSLPPSGNRGVSIATPSHATVATTANPGPTAAGTVTSQVTPVLRAPGVRTITPGTTSPSAQTPGVTQPSQTPMQPSTSTVPPSSVKQGTVRTITPGSVSTAIQLPNSPSIAQTPAQPSTTNVPTGRPGPVRTITPPAATNTPANGGNPARPGPVGSSIPSNASRPAPQMQTITPGTALPSPNASAPLRPGPNGTAATTITPGLAGSRPSTPSPSAQRIINLVVFPGDIRASSVLRSGQAATFSALIRNNGTAGTQGASVVFKLLVSGRQAAVSAPISFNVPAGGTFLASWSSAIPVSQQIQIVVSVAANGDMNPANKQAALLLPVAH